MSAPPSCMAVSTQTGTRSQHDREQAGQAGGTRRCRRLGPGDECHGEEDRDEHEGGAHVGLQQDQAHGHEDDHQAQQEPRQLADAVADAREVRGQEEDRGDLHELRRLHAELADAQPGTGAVHLPAEDAG